MTQVPVKMVVRVNAGVSGSQLAISGRGDGGPSCARLPNARLPAMTESASVTKDIAAPPELLYAMVADLTRMGEWSPENEGGDWLDDVAAAHPGARFRGRNRNGTKSWKSLVTIVDAEPGRLFSFRVTVGPVKISDWSYTFDAVPSGCRVTESWLDLRPRWFRPIAAFVTGVSDRPTHNRRGMELTLERLDAAVASGRR